MKSAAFPWIHRLFLLVPLLAMAIAMPAPLRAQSGLVTFQFAGTLSNVIDNTAGDLATRGIAVGAEFSGSLVFDSTINPTFSIPAAGTLNRATAFYPSIVSETFTIKGTSGTYTFGFGPTIPPGAFLNVVDSEKPIQLGSDQLSAGVSGGIAPWVVTPPGLFFSGNYYGHNFRLADWEGTAFTSVAQPLALDLSQFEEHEVTFSTFVNGADDPAKTYVIYGNITSLSVIPEPSACVAITGLAALGMAYLRRRRT